MAVDSDRRIPGYPNDPVREKTRITPFEVYEYETPFNYPNVEVDRVWKGGERHGIELFAVKTTEDGRMMREPADGIIIHEDDPIIRVAVLGSACTPPGVVFIEATPVDGFRHEGENEDAMPVRFRIDNLWGMHLRGDLLGQGATYHTHPLAGMSCAMVEIPPSRTIRVMAAGAIPAWSEDGYPDDAHYSLRTVRTTVMAG